MKKRGSHVGVILSFIIFVTFVVFLYSVMEPTFRTQKEKDSILEYLKIELVKRISANLTTVTISGGEDTTENCLEVGEEELGIKDLNSIVKDEDKIIVPSTSSGGVLRMDWANPAEKVFKIYSSEEEFNTDPSNGITCTAPEIELVRTKGYIFETKINSLIEKYGDDYEGSKEEFKVPVGSEFGFSFKNRTDDVIGTEEKNISTSVYAEEIPIQYVDMEANINSGFINIKVW